MRLCKTIRARCCVIHLLLSLCFLFLMPYQARADIIVTLPPLAGLVSLLDSHIEVSCLLAAGTDPHHVQLSPRQAEALQQARLLIRTSMDDGDWTRLGSTASTLDLWPNTGHAWLSPRRVKAALPRLAVELHRLYPGRREVIASGLRHAETATEHMWIQWQDTLMAFRTGGVIMQHAAWQGVMEAFGVPVLAVLESRHHGREHGPHMLEHALQMLKQHPQATLIGDMRHNNRALEWLANHTGHRIIYLDALGTCDMDWQALMQANLKRLRGAIP
ncbi:MAG: metal ABC transporter substrate-binding protein [Mariprofundaceae bacterium]